MLDVVYHEISKMLCFNSSSNLVIFEVNITDNTGAIIPAGIYPEAQCLHLSVDLHLDDLCGPFQVDVVATSRIGTNTTQIYDVSNRGN